MHFPQPTALPLLNAHCADIELSLSQQLQAHQVVPLLVLHQDGLQQREGHTQDKNRVAEWEAGDLPAGLSTAYRPKFYQTHRRNQVPTALLLRRAVHLP